jgi:hypothetical protein
MSSTWTARAWLWRRTWRAGGALALAALACALASPATNAGTTGGIAGHITTRDGFRVAHLEVTIYNPVTGRLSAISDSRGFYSIIGIPPGRYEFISTHAAPDYYFSAQCLTVEVEADDVLNVNLWVDREWYTRESSCEIEG